MDFLKLPYRLDNSNSKLYKKPRFRRVPLSFYNFDFSNFFTDSYLKVQSLASINKFCDIRNYILNTNKNIFSSFIYYSSMNNSFSFVKSDEYFPLSDYDLSNLVLHKFFKKFYDFTLQNSISKSYIFNKILFFPELIRHIIIIFLVLTTIFPHQLWIL